MKWKQITLETTTQAEDLVSSMLSDLGVEGIEIEDKVPLTEEETKGMFIDVLPDLGEDDGTAVIRFYADPDADIDGLLRNVGDGLEELRAFTDIGAGTLSVSETEDKDWINNWKEFFHSFSVGRFFIKPTWEPEPAGADPERIRIEIDPGTAFGTGSHETTQLCLTALEDHVTAGDRVLDIGTGSGILSIASVLLGARDVYGIDIDPEAVRVARENAAQNHVDGDGLAFDAGDLLTDRALAERLAAAPYDVAVANILAPVICALIPVTGAFVRPGGWFITSGIIDTAEETVRRAFESDPSWELAEARRQGDWVCLIARRVR